MAASSSSPGTVTVTFGDNAENHVGMQKLSAEGEDRGFSVEELANLHAKLAGKGCEVELVDLRSLLPEGVRERAEPATLLIWRRGVQRVFGEGGADALYREIIRFPHDKQYYDTRRSKVLNKQARWNLCIADEGQRPDYETGKGTVIAFSELPYISSLRTLWGRLLGPVAAGLVAETNYYFDPVKCGIGFHGDAERKKVVGVRLGEAFPFHYQWYVNSERIGTRYITSLGHGDIYFMSSKAVGTDWKRKKVYTLRHAAGFHKKYVGDS